MVAAAARWAALAALAAAFGSLEAGAAAVTPVEKVIDLMKKLRTDVQAEGQHEAEQYDKYACFCKEQADEKQYNIEKSDKKVKKLTARINKLGADIAELNQEIVGLGTEISDNVNEVENLTTTRDQEHKVYLAEEADLSRAIAALKQAIEALEESKEQMDDDVKLNFVQVRRLAETVMHGIRSVELAVEPEDLEAVESLAQLGQEPPAYQYRSNDVIAVLTGLLNKQFLPQKKVLDTTEFEAQAAFEKRTLNLKNEIKFAEKDKAEMEEVVGKKSEAKEKAEGDKTEESKDRAADQTFLTELTGECEQKAGLWDQRSKSRAQEITAISEALSALEEGVAPNYGANAKLVGLEQEGAKAAVVAAHTPASFVQLSDSAHSAHYQVSEASGATRHVKLTSFLAAAALKLNSKVLSVAAVKVSAAEDHFVKVRQIIKDLVAKLDADAGAEASQKSFCDTEMGQATLARDKAQASIEGLAAEISELGAERALLERDVADLSADIAAVRHALGEATELRTIEKQENDETIRTADEGKTAVEFAIQVLQEYYAPGAGLIQYVPANADREGKTVSDRAPEVFDSKYGGNQQASKGVMGMLEVILADFERTISKTAEEERTAAGEFTDFETDANGSIDSKSESRDTKTTRVSEIGDSLVDRESELKDEQMLLDSARKTLSQLQEQCVQGEETYAERVAKRKKEIEALKEALETLESWQA